MLRTAAVRALRAASTSRIIRQASSARPQALNTFLRSSPAAPSLALPSIRLYSAPAGLSKDEVQGRIMDLLKNFDKITATAHFGNDLGLDSLDTVEVVMAIEEEFSIEIPDKEADAIHSIDQAVSYICSQPDAH
ncbi:hypothetical protein EPUS_03248 [Endocarpon pusillum Z07020]|uniref:Acyl carrier protein n=1 Tax=Endocarpon pusillum (strain Z07020 / HMAS-L-300199) TaxID=1263415 RepID=U1HZ87_ENDPU|nr:uncharacterized protein EPUS_03248 [Endocarpon pusillum Z07020]ERF74864.1 hypothetical protein EPUS_03248 [Endocarpon pusillum Z07020]